MPFTPLEATIRTNRLINLPVHWQDELIYPHYNGLSIYNLSQTVMALLGAPAESPLDEAVWAGESPYGRVDRVVVVISDGLGYRRLQQLAGENPQLADDMAGITDGRGAVPLTSVAPSTTACALPTFWTARHPGTHGMLGTALLLREFAMMVDMLAYSPGAVTVARASMPLDGWGMPADRFIPVPSIAEQLGDIPLHLVILHGLFGTGLSRLMHRGVKQHHAYHSSTDMFPRLGEVLAQTAGQRCCVFMYIPTIDTLSHAYGCDAPYVNQEIAQQIAGLNQLLKSAAMRDGRTLVMVCADHGHYNAPIGIDLENDQRLASVRKAMRLSFGGDERFGYLYLRDRTSQQVIDTFTEYLSEQVAVIEAETAVDCGLFGEAAHPEVLNRIGDVIVLPRQGIRLVDAARQMRTVSIHSGLSEAEMLVPLLWKRI